MPSRKAVALLAFLAVSGQAQSRDTIATLFWPDYDQQQARAALRRDLAALNQCLPGAWMESNRELIRLKPEVAGSPDAKQAWNGTLWLDVDQFRQALARCQAHGHGVGEVCPACLVSLTEAAKLYQGDFLAGFSLRDSPAFDDWRLFQSESLRRDLAGALERLTRGYGNQGQLESAIAYARQWLALDPLDEAAHRRLMHLYLYADQPAAALRQYDECTRLLDVELGTLPTTETESLYQAIKARQVPTRVPFERTALDAPLPPFLQEPALIEAHPRLFVAREGELAQLDRRLALAYGGQGRVIFVSGEAGSGKTALVQEFARRAQLEHPDLVVATGNCQAFAGIGDPCLPFRELLALLTGDVEARWAAGAISRTQALRLWSLLPLTIQIILSDSANLVNTLLPGAALLQRAQAAAPADTERLQQLAALVGAQTPAATPLQQHDLFAQTTRLLLALARQRPLLLILDDLHWADVGSLNLLFHLGRQLAGSRILVIGLYRPADVAVGRPLPMDAPSSTAAVERHPLATVIAELQRTYGEIVIDLEQADGRLFVQALLDRTQHRFGAAFQAMLYRHTAGHALFTVEVLRAMQSRGDLVQDAEGVWREGPTLDWETLPPQVEGVIGERIGRLPLPLQTVLTIGAVEGETFTAETIAQVQGIAGRSIIHQLSSLLDKQHGLVRVQDIQHLPNGRLSRYRFRHHLFQKYLYQQLDVAERASYHEAVGQALAQLYGEQAVEIAPQLARHFELAGLPAMAIIYLRQAGDTAARLYANHDAGAYYRRALALVTPTTPRADLAHLYTQLGRVLELDSHFDEALATYTALEERARQAGDQAMELAVLIAKLPLYATPTPFFDPALGHTLGEQALRLARVLQDQAAEAKILWTLAWIAMLRLQMSQSIRYGEQSLALARALQLPEQMALTLTDLALCYGTDGQMDKAKRALYEADTLWQKLNNLPMRANNLSMLAQSCAWWGEYAEAIAVAREAQAITQQLHNLWGESYSQYKVGFAYWEQGDADGAIGAMQRSIDLAEQAGFVSPQIETRSDLALAYSELGAHERSAELIDAALRAADTYPQTPHPVYVLAVMARLHLRQRQWDTAAVAIAMANRHPVRNGMPGYFVGAAVAFVDAELALHQHDYRRALTLIQEWLTDLHRYGLRKHIPYALHMQGKIHLALGDRAAAHASWQAARSEAEALGSRWALWQILASLAQIEADADGAAQLRQDAQAIITYIADHISDDELRNSFLRLPAVRVAYG
ncbi:MAG: AAA family ATPase [Caldilineaceae bacterium]|nr:AAA family ATPase [Caldilineaceae bacterium]